METESGQSLCGQILTSNFLLDSLSTVVVSLQMPWILALRNKFWLDVPQDYPGSYKQVAINAKFSAATASATNSSTRVTMIARGTVATAADVGVKPVFVHLLIH